MSRVLTQRDLNPAHCSRASSCSGARAIERLAGLQAQWEPAAYLGLRT